MEYTTTPLTINTITLSLATIHNLSSISSNTKPPILFLHGFGSCKEDLSDIIHHPTLSSFPFLAYDAPGCGSTTSSDASTSTIKFQVSVAEAVLAYYGIQQFHLIGHSMGGLTALTLAHANPSRVLSFMNIKGNLSPEDCFLSRQIHDHHDLDPELFLERFINRTRAAPGLGNALYASTLKHRVRAEAVAPIFTSMVEMSDGEDLMGWFLGLRDQGVKVCFMYGEGNRGLSYLGRLRGEEGVWVEEVKGSGHFPMYSNPVGTWEVIERFLGEFI